MIRFLRPLSTVVGMCAAAILVSACGGGGSGSSVPAPAASPTTPSVGPHSQPTVAPSPGASPVVDAAAYICPTSDTAAAAVTGDRTAEGSRRMTVRRAPNATSAATSGSTQLVAVTYDAPTATAQRSVLAARESALGTTLQRTYTFSHIGLVTHVLAVPAARVASVEASLRSQPGFHSVGLTGGRRYPLSVTTPYFTNDPYFTGFSAPVAPVTGATAPPATFEVGPLEESADVPGQWDMHATRLEYAFGYSQANNGSGITNPAALGSSAVKIAVIDTGQDTTHPELSSKIVYQRCFITNPSTSVQSVSTFTTDEDGHGTDVAGIAGEDTNNAFGFTGAGGNVVLYGYRVFPTPDDNCTNENTTDDQCSSETPDIASAIEDAVTARVNVISMSLGGSPCVNGADPDTTEGNAVADAIAANIIVVAAAGNSSGPPVEAPGCDPGVIAVGATGLADGTPNASGKAGGSPSAPFEYVASYTDYGSTGAAVNSSSAWGIVAPGGDPSSDNDTDDLHWIENIWTSTPYMAGPHDTSFQGSCAGDYPSQTGTIDCRILIAGTSMATPHVAGAAALILSVNSSYQSPTLMKQLLCSTADDISDPHEGCGRLDVYRAMATALGDPNIPAPRPIP
jgi:subtilisin family serine protease